MLSVKNSSKTFARSTTAVAALMLLGLTSTAAMAQAFSAGNLIVSRTVYNGVASTVTVGQALPGGGNAVGDGSFANVFKNETVDSSFGVTSSIFLDQVTTSGSRVSSLAIDSSQMTTSFASKSELALNISSDGSAVTFMGYKAPTNTLDVSNSNTSQAFDSTNPVSAIYQRAIGQVNLNSGAVQVTGVNAYSGNNGRAAVLANGNYYMVGNAGNSGAGVTGAQLTSLSNNTGVQMIAAGASGNTTVVGVANGTPGSLKGYQRGYAGTPTDKTGKVDNFRGLDLVKNADGSTGLIVTKGSGGNGLNGVYQVGGSILPTAATADTTTITPLAGVASGANVHPFGVWSDGQILLVNDEGDSKLMTDSTKVTNTSPLTEYQKTGSSWTKIASFGANLIGTNYTVDGYGYTLTLDGFHNMTVGGMNSDGSYDVYGTTATVSEAASNTGSVTDHDLGADPNQIFHCNTGTGLCSIIETALNGERLGGVALNASSVTAVPEPDGIALAIVGVAGLGYFGRKSRRSNANA